MKNQIKLNSEVSIDLQKLVESRLLIQANSGGGKSYLIRRILEQSHGSIQQIVIDLEGEFHTLREKFDYLLVSKDGDVPAHVKTAGLLAQEILRLNVSAIIDLYELSIQERKHFARLFLESMINSPKSLWHNCLVIIDEAHVFCPQEGESEAIGAVNDLSTKGRKRGFCSILATQRLGKLDKDSAAECNNKLIGRSSLDIDMERAGKELGFTRREPEKILSLKRLKPGEFYAFGPAIFDEVQLVKVGEVQTSHPKVGSRAFLQVVPPTDKIKQALKKLAELPQVAEKKLASEKEFKEEIVRLKRELSTVRLNRKTDHIQPDPKMAERQIRQAVTQYQKEVNSKMQVLADELKKYQNLFSKVEELMKIRRSMFKNPTLTLPEHHLQIKLQPSGVGSPEPMPERGAPTPRKTETSSGYSQAKAGSKAGEDVFEENHRLGSGERKLLAAITQYPEGITREHLTVLTGYKRSSRDTYIQRLRMWGLVELDNENVVATQDGIEKLGSNYDPLPFGLELQDYIMARIPEGEKKILKILIESYPNAVAREILSEQAGYQRSSRDTYLQRLKSRQLVKFEGRGMVKATERLFD